MRDLYVEATVILGFMHANPFSPSHRPFEWLCAGHIFGSWRSRWNWVLASDGWLGRTPGVAPLTKHYGWTRANFGRMATSFEGCSFEMNSHVFDAFGEWLVQYRILSFEGCSNEVRFGLDCSIISVRHWCKNFSFIYCDPCSIGLPHTVPKGLAWKHHDYCMINSFCSWLHVSIVVECCIFSLFFIVVTVSSCFCGSAYHIIDSFFIFYDFSTIALEHTPVTKDPFIQGFGYASRVCSWQDMLKFPWTYYLVKAQVFVVIFYSC